MNVHRTLQNFACSGKRKTVDPIAGDPGVGIAALGKSGRAVGLPSRVFAPPRQGYLSLLIE